MLPNVNILDPLPPGGATTAVFQNLAGAIDVNAKRSNTGAIVGGVIGGSVALGLVVAGFICFFIWRKRQALRREASRREQNIFIDLDGEEDGNVGVLAQIRQNKNKNKNLGVNDSAEA